MGDTSHILLTSMSYFGSAVLLDDVARTDITRTLTRDWLYRRALHTGGWRVSVSPTLVEPSVAMPGPCGRLKQHILDEISLWFLMCR